jgi:hypothetical protein
MNEKWVIKSVVVVSYGNDDTKTVMLQLHQPTIPSYTTLHSLDLLLSILP